MKCSRLVIPLLGVCLAACSGAVDGLLAPELAGSAALSDGVVGTAYDVTIAAKGTAPIVMIVSSGTLPPGLTMGQDGRISGTPTAQAASSFSVTATNPVGSVTVTRTIDVFVLPSITGPVSPLPDATVGQPYTRTVTATGSSPISYSVHSGSLPAGLTLVAATGVISGTPTGPGTATFQVAATNAIGRDTRAYTLDVLATPTGPTITAPSVFPDARIGWPYVQGITATGTTPITWSISAGSLPAGFTLDGTTGIVAGIATGLETANFTVTATNAYGTDSHAYSIQTTHQPILASLSPSSGVAGGTITLLGAGFSTTPASNIVTFDATAAVVLQATANALTVEVPSGLAASSEVRVTIGGNASATKTFTLDTTSVVFVDASATGGNDGSSWSDAYTTLQTALASATSTDDIWVAAGTYTPGTAVTDYFAMVGDHVYGGFAGSEALRSQRDIVSHKTILSGDINADSVGFTNTSDNTQHVVRIGSTGNVLDGVHVVHAYDASGIGGGIVAMAAASGTLSDVTCTTNLADYGGGLTVEGATIVAERCVFHGNRANTFGGGLRVADQSTFAGSLTMRACVVADNQAAGGGGLDCRLGGVTTIENTVIAGNVATGNGGGILDQGGGVDVIASTIVSNAAATGGGWYRTLNSAIRIDNSIFWNNTASTANPDIYSDGTTTFDHCVVVASSVGGAGVNYRDCLTADPLFSLLADPDGPDDRYLTSDDGLQLQTGSSAIDTADTLGPTTDILGIARPQGAAYDIGAYEKQ
ncbi:MAG: putative Ig domain-containing protein [Planctomycetes bacterium]|nr:putative Ig domain-containing protein [Planctomycetota bacterium]MCA8972606.1 putative Ig domain-containing protein [Planctomycetota bacterium]